MKYEPTVTGVVKEKLQTIQSIEEKLISEKIGSNSFLFTQMMAETNRINFITKPLEKTPNTNKHQNLY